MGAEHIAFYDSWYELGALMGKTARREFFGAILDYRYTGVEPTFTHKAAEAGWSIVRPALKRAVERDLTRFQGGVGSEGSDNGHSRFTHE